MPHYLVRLRHDSESAIVKSYPDRIEREGGVDLFKVKTRMMRVFREEFVGLARRLT
jgi:hypothetical protein